MADDDAEKRRIRAEARRRRILEGGATRLESITKRPLTAEERAAIAPPIENTSTDTIDDAFAFNDTQPIQPSFTPLRSDQQQQSEAEPLLDVLFATRMHVPLYALFIYSIFVIYKVTDTYLYLPLLMWEFLEYFYFQAQQDKTPYAAAITSLLGVKPGQVNLAYKILTKVSLLLKDACLYTFTIILFNLVKHYFIVR